MYVLLILLYLKQEYDKFPAIHLFIVGCNMYVKMSKNKTLKISIVVFVEVKNFL